MIKKLGYGVLFLLAACGRGDQKAKPQNQVQAPLTRSANPDAFNRSFGKVMTDYYSLKDNFVAENDTAINQSAKSMIISVDSIQLDELKSDTNIVATARTYTQGISAELKGLLGEKDREEKRKSFQMVGEQLYDLIRTVQYDQVIVYHDFCPMAFNDQGALWLSNSRDIKNPYIPKKMLTCGEIKDSIDFRK